MITTVLRILCVDPHPVVCAGLSHLGRDESGLTFIGSATRVEDALKLVAASRPDVVMMDPELLGADGLALCRRIKAVTPEVRVVLYTAGATAAGFALQARVAGADGMLDKATAADELFRTLRAIGRGQIALPPLDPAELEAAAHRVEPADLALLAMLADRTPAADVADTLRMDRRGLARRIERMLPRLRGLRPHAA
jgi:DNA-binding NarL/FixJ family response regulator